MSWPTDRQPRHKLAVTHGILDMPPINSNRNEAHHKIRWHASYAILDRAFCHRTVAVYRSEDFHSHGHRIDGAKARAQAAAEARLAELQAGDKVIEESRDV